MIRRKLDTDAYHCKAEAKWYGTTPKSESALRELIEELRADGYTNNELEQLIDDFYHVQKQFAKHNEEKEIENMDMNGTNTAVNPLEIKRTRIPEGYYEALTKGARLEKHMDGKYVLVLDLELTDPATGRIEEKTQRYYQGFFQNMYDNLKRFYGSEAADCETLGDILKVTNRIKWGAQVSYKGDFLNINPVKIAPSISLEDTVAVIDLF